MFQTSGRRATFYFWLLFLVAIPLISAWGRPLLGALRTVMPAEGLAVMMLLASLGGLGACASWVYRGRHGKRTLLLLVVWIIPLFLLLPLTLPVVEERLHFLLFGGFGFFSMLLFSFPVAVVVTLACAGLDELWQWILPDRFGDWRDVGINAVAGIGGVVAAWLGKRR